MDGSVGGLMTRDYECNSELREKQVDILDSILDDMNEGNKSLLVIAPPALGKTVIMGGLAKRYSTKRPNDVVLVISHIRLLVDQSRASFKRFFSLDSGILRAQEMPAPDDRVVLATVQSASMLDKIILWKNRLPENVNVGLVIVDESHTLNGTDRMDKILDTYFPDAAMVGFTASPFKDNKSMHGLFDKVTYSVSLQEAIDLGYLVKPVMHGIVLEDKNDLDSVITQVAGMIIANGKQQSVVFMRSQADCKEFTSVLNEQGIPAVQITADVKQDIREKALTSFRDNTPDAPQVLVTVNVLTAGADFPHLQAVYMPYGTGSVSTYIQRLGRVLRTAEGKTHGDIYIGGSDPEVEKGKWEKIQKKALNAGKRCDNALEDYELNGDLMDEPTKTTTLKTIQLSKAIKKKGMQELAEQVMNRTFPTEFLEHLIPFKKYPASARITANQASLLKKNGIDPSRMKRNEASSIIDAISKKQGWHKPKPEVPMGKHKGTPVNMVPYTYINLVSKRNSRYYNEALATFFNENK